MLCFHVAYIPGEKYSGSSSYDLGINVSRFLAVLLPLSQNIILTFSQNYAITTHMYQVLAIKFVSLAVRVWK